MDDSSIDGMLNMLKGNREMTRQMFKAQGHGDLSDAQIDNMMGMMNKDMFKQASHMMRNNPDLVWGSKVCFS